VLAQQRRIRQGRGGGDAGRAADGPRAQASPGAQRGAAASCRQKFSKVNVYSILNLCCKATDSDFPEFLPVADETRQGRELNHPSRFLMYVSRAGGGSPHIDDLALVAVPIPVRCQSGRVRHESACQHAFLAMRSRVSLPSPLVLYPSPP